MLGLSPGSSAGAASARDCRELENILVNDSEGWNGLNLLDHDFPMSYAWRTEIIISLSLDLQLLTLIMS